MFFLKNLLYYLTLESEECIAKSLHIIQPCDIIRNATKNETKHTSHH